MNKWFYINALILIYACFSVAIFFHGLPQIFGLVGLFIIIYNWSRHAIFSMIRSDIPRDKKIKYAQFSKKVLPLHKWTGSLAFLIIIIHAILIFIRYGFWYQSPKFLFGLLAICVLLFQVVTGWLRWYRTTVRRRYLHWMNAFILVLVIVIHILL